MTTMTFRAGLVFAAMAAAIGDPAVRGEGEGAVERRDDVEFARPGGSEPLRLDVAWPSQGAGPFPIVMVIHGGGWEGGHKEEGRAFAEGLVRRGYVAVSPEYRLSDKATFPAQLHDVKAAVRWAKGHAGEFKADPGRVGAMGFSAGGHLALLLGLTGPADGLEGEAAPGSADSSVKAVVNYFGPSDLAASDTPKDVRSMVRRLVGGSPAEKPAAVAQASPLTFVGPGDAPVLTFQGTKDHLVPPTQAVKLAEAMTAAGVPGRVELLVGAGHGWSGPTMERTTAETIDFFDAHLKPAGPAAPE